MEKLEYAIRLRPADTGYLLAKADLLECQLRFPEAAAVYRTACELDPASHPARTRLSLCTQLIGPSPANRTPLWHDTLARLYVEMTAGPHRSFAEIYEVATLVREHAKEQVLARDSAQGKVLANCLKLDAYAGLTVNLTNTSVTDLSPLQGLPIRRLIIEGCAIADLSPLRGMPLWTLDMDSTKVTSLEPLRVVPDLRDISLMDTAVTDLGPLHGLLNLIWIEMAGAPVQDLTPLQGTNVGVLRFARTKVDNLAPLATLPLTELNCAFIPALDFSPLAACTKLSHLDISGTALRNLEIFRGSKLVTLYISRTGVRDLSPLAGSPLQYLAFFDTPVTDSTPLLSCPALIYIGLARGVQNVESLRALPKVQRISFKENKGAPAQTVAEFWKEHPAGK